MYCSYEAVEGRHGEVGIPAFGGGNDSNMSIGGGGILPLPSECHRPVHCNLINTGAVSGGIEEDGSTDETLVVETGGYLSGDNDNGNNSTKGGQRHRSRGGELSLCESSK